MKKPVWRINNGDGVPSDFSKTGVLFYDRSHLNSESPLNCYGLEWVSVNNDEWLSIAAYQTTRTKTAKYERVECLRCTGKGIWYEPVAWSSDEIPRFCNDCNGKGCKLEAVK